MIKEWKGDKVGIIRSAHGLKGDVMITHQLDNSNDLTQWEALMIELNPGSFIPFFIEEIEMLNDEDILCKLEEINSREEAVTLNGKAVYTTIHHQVKAKKEDEWEALIGYEVMHNDIIIGKISALLNVSMNMLLQVERENKEILIPATEEFIMDIDPKKKVIRMQLPDGLLDL